MAHIGSWGTPDYGVTEAVQGGLNSVWNFLGQGNSGTQNAFGTSSANNGSDIFPNGQSSTNTASTQTTTGGGSTVIPKTNTTTTTQPKNTTTTKAGGSSGQVAGASTNQSYSMDQQVQGQKDAAQQAKDAQNALIRSGIDQAYNPIFAELDRQIGLAPEQKVAFSDEITRLATTQRANAETQRQAGVAFLDQARTEEDKQTKSSLRDLEGDIRNQLQAQQFYFGAKGAGDSSAPLVASEAVAKAGLKSRGGILQTRNDAFNKIDLKQADVNNLATKQLGDIENWKATKLFDIGQWYTDRVNQLESQKASASGEKAKALLNLQLGTEQEFRNRLAQLDDAVTNYKTSISTWQMQRQAELEDYKTKLSLSSQYSTDDSAKIRQNAIKTFTDLTAKGYSPQQADALVQQGYGLSVAGYQLTPEEQAAIARTVTPINPVTGQPLNFVDAELPASTGASPSTGLSSIFQ